MKIYLLKKDLNQNSLKCMRNDFSILTEMTSEVTNL